MEKEILEGNKLIAEFEKRAWETNWFCYPNVYPYYYDKPKSYVNKTKRVCLSDLQYHTSWDWIMPVCKKLDRLAEDGIIEHTIDYQFWCDKLDDAVTRNYDIAPVFKITVEFIQWYNTQTSFTSK